MTGTELQMALEPYLPKILVYVQKPRTLDDIVEAFAEGNIYRKSSANQKKTEVALPAESLFNALNRLVSWSKDPRHRLLTFLHIFKHTIWLEADTFVANDRKRRVELAPKAPTTKAAATRPALLKHGTPMRLLEMF